MSIIDNSPIVIENTVSTSRNHQEVLSIKQGNTAYGCVAALIDSNIDAIDSLAEYLGELVASGVVKKVYDNQYFDPKYGKFKNFLTRNIYITPNKKDAMEFKRNAAGYAAMMGTELAVKWAARGIQHLANEKDKFQTLYNAYSILYCYANRDNANMEKSKMELSKIRNSFPLSQMDINKMKIKAEKSDIRILGDLDLRNFDGIDGSYRENISYLLYSIHCQKYGDTESSEDNLIEYYNLLGYHTNEARSLIHQNHYNYETISSDQRQYLAVARGMVKNMFVNLPDFDLTRISQTALEMAKYDPYDIRRKRAKKAVKPVMHTIAGLFSQNPAMVINAGVEALSVFNLDDNSKEAARNRLKEWNIDEKAITQIFDQSKNIKTKVKEFITVENE